MLFKKFDIFFCISFILISIILPSKSETTTFPGYRFIRVTPLTKNDLQILKDLESSSDNYIFLNGINKIRDDVDVIVTTHRFTKFFDILKDNKILSKNVTTDTQSLLNSETLNQTSFSYNYFHSFNSINLSLNALLDQFPNNTKDIIIGKTVNENHLRIIKVSNDTHKIGTKKPGIFLEGGIHGSAWISPATVIFIMEQLLRSVDTAVQSLLNNYDWYFMPILNPDGYQFSEQETIWTKNRSPQKNFCNGVDLNRNWDMNWHNSTSESTNKWSLESYPGSECFSEIETKSLSEFLFDLKQSDRLHLYLSFQSGNQKFLYPFGSTENKPDNERDLEKISEVVLKAISERRGTPYAYGSIFHEKYPIYGTSIDWVYGVLHVPLSFRWELPNGYPSTRDRLQIIPIAEETFDSVKALIVQAQTMGYFGKI